MPLRFPFRRAGATDPVLGDQQGAVERGFEKTPVTGSRPKDIKEPVEYKLSEINDGGVFLPPSPIEKPTFWHSRSNTSTTSSNHRSLLSENEPFNISRESFESYRRSFDISARSPIPEYFDNRPRLSLDARHSLDARRSLDVRRSRARPRSSLQEQRPSSSTADESPHADADAEQEFEDVGLDDEPKPAPKKKGLFARFGGESSHENGAAGSEEKSSGSGVSSHLHFGFPGRKRAQSGQGAELKSMSRAAESAQGEARTQVEGV
ncbi:uncharacterized protein EI97DRAFT_473979 [Westerdykella ornata]|uniref:Uncharacterized protein n=1 Tax=Westerdykella ornata TaxID=318751 RepID=A0A6A6JJD1_WESOR|nr:uncharacterized protein EI97DRAFT_473979 [Westerdykella ornata]KAF2276088.1 hypothetical protein EI97DRAFT_473979 [Westerdykella ornata]